MTLTIMNAAKAERLLLKTRAVQKAWQVIDRAQSERTIAMIVANPGCQKSYSIKSWRRQRGVSVPHVYIEADLLTSPRPMLNALCQGLGVASVGNRNMVVTRDMLVERLAEKPVLIIVDQADMITVRALETLRTIWDRVSDALDTDGESAFPLAIFGTPELRQRIRRPELERLHRRIGEIAELDRLNRKELDMALTAKWPQVRIDEDGAEELLSLSRGSFGWLNRIMPIAQKLAAKAGSDVNTRILRNVSKYLLGLPEAE